MSARVLLAGIGNVFLGDDGFGVEVARRLARETLPEGVTVGDVGIRSLHLAYALPDRPDLLLFVDAVRRGEAPSKASGSRSTSGIRGGQDRAGTESLGGRQSNASRSAVGTRVRAGPESDCRIRADGDRECTGTTLARF